MCFVAEAPTFTLSDSPAQDCNVRVLEIARRWAGLPGNIVDNTEIRAELRRGAYEDSQPILLTVTENLHTRVRYIGRWMSKEDGQVQAPAQKQGFLHISVTQHTTGEGKTKVVQMLHARAELVLGCDMLTSPRMQHSTAESTAARLLQLQRDSVSAREMLVASKPIGKQSDSWHGGRKTQLAQQS